MDKETGEKRKKRILAMGESCFLSTGFSNYLRELLTRLHQTNKYEIAEYGSYGHPDDPRRLQFPWKQYFAVPTNAREAAEYSQASRHPDDRGQNICCVKGTHIITSGGIKNIEDVTINDKVLTNDGSYQKVVKVIVNENDRDIVELRSNNCSLPVRLTVDHPVLCIKNKGRVKVKGKHLTKPETYFVKDAKYIPASEIQNGDYVIFPTNKYENDIDSIDLADFCNLDDLIISEKTLKTSRSNQIPRFIPLNSNILRLFGFFVSEGSLNHSNKSGISFGMNAVTEQEHLSFIEDTIRKYFSLNTRRETNPKKHNGETVACCSVVLFNVLNNLFGGLSRTRKIPECILHLPQYKLSEFLSSLFIGDGSKTNGGAGGLTYNTASKQLGFDLFQILLKLGCLSNLSYVQKELNGKYYDQYNVSIMHMYGKRLNNLINYSDDIECTLGHHKESWIDQETGHAIMRVKNCDIISDKFDSVFNLEIENNNNYVTSFVVHNCQFGANKFDEVVLDFQPDFLITLRDTWMDRWVARSPYRHLFKWFWLACVDSAPQQEDWIQVFESCDYVMGYTDFGINTLRHNSPRFANKGSRLHMKPLRTPIDTETFRPMNKEEMKREWLQIRSQVPIIMGNQVQDRLEDRKIILSTMRNQARKLFPDLIDGFARMKIKYRGNPKADSAILWLHSSYPDNASSYDYPRHIRRISQGYHGVLLHYPDLWKYVLNTFVCDKCGHAFAAHAIHLHSKPVENRAGQAGGGRIYIQCQKCGQNTASCPTTAGGVSRDVLAQIYNCADLYVQASIAEGEGLPILEAKSCGIPVIASDWSAMSEKVRVPDEYEHIDKENYTEHLGGIPLKERAFYYEPETNQRRHLPDIEDMADKMFEVITNDEYREQLSKDARRSVIENHDAADMVNRWQFIFDNIEPHNRADTWDKPVTLVEPGGEQPPTGQGLEQFIVWCYTNILKDGVDPKGLQDWMKSVQEGKNTPDSVYKYFIEEAQQRYMTALRMKEAQDRFHGKEVKKDNAINALLVVG